MRLSVIYLVTYFVGGDLLLLNVVGFRPFRCDGALVRHCILVFESTWGVPCARTMPGKLKAIVKHLSERAGFTKSGQRLMAQACMMFR